MTTTLTAEQTQIAALVRRLKKGDTLTADERQRLNGYRRDHIAREGFARTQEFLVESLTMTDAIFWPSRRYTRTLPEQLGARCYFREEGLPFPRSGNASERKEAERTRQDLAPGGLITLIRKGSRAVGYKLTSECDWRTRSLCGRPGLKDCLRLMERLRVCVSVGRCSEPSKIDGACHVNELDLAGLTFYDEAGEWRARVYENEFALLPAIIRGGAKDCVCDGSPDGGCHEWSLTAAGVAVLENPPLVENLPNPDPDAVELYADIFESCKFPRCFTAEEIEKRDAWKTEPKRKLNEDTV